MDLQVQSKVQSELRPYYYMYRVVKTLESSSDLKTLKELQKEVYWHRMEQLCGPPRSHGVREAAASAVSTLRTAARHAVADIEGVSEGDLPETFPPGGLGKVSGMGHVGLGFRSLVAAFEEELVSLELALRDEAQKLRKFHRSMGLVLLVGVLASGVGGWVLGEGGTDLLAKVASFLGLCLAGASAVLLAKLRAEDYIATFGGAENTRFVRDQWLLLVLLVVACAFQALGFFLAL